MRYCVVLSPDDNVGTLLQAGKKDDVFSIVTTSLEKLGEITLLEDIPSTHKTAVKAIREGERIIKFSEVIGLASSRIEPGEYAHVHNIVSIAGRAGVRR